MSQKTSLSWHCFHEIILLNCKCSLFQCQFTWICLYFSTWPISLSLKCLKASVHPRLRTSSKSYITFSNWKVPVPDGHGVMCYIVWHPQQLISLIRHFQNDLFFLPSTLRILIYCLRKYNETYVVEVWPGGWSVVMLDTYSITESIMTRRCSVLLSESGCHAAVLSGANFTFFVPREPVSAGIRKTEREKKKQSSDL